MANNIIGIKNGNTIVPYMAATKRTKVMDFSAAGLITGTNWTTTRAVAIAYSDSSGKWRLCFNVYGTISSAATTLNITFSSSAAVVFAATPEQAITANLVLTGTGSKPTLNAYTNPDSALFTVITSDGAGFTRAAVSGDVELKSEPTWAAANMEGVVQADVYIAPASASVDGIVNRSAQTFAGVKTFNDGVKLDDAAGQSVLNSYTEYAEGNLDTITPTSGTWATIDSAKYKATRIGNKVTFWFRIESTTAASNLSSFEVRLPGGVDAPAYFSTTANGEIGFYGYGCAAEEASGSGRIPITIGIEKAASIQQLKAYFTAGIAAKLVIGTIEYTV